MVLSRGVQEEVKRKTDQLRKIPHRQLLKVLRDGESGKVSLRLFEPYPFVIPIGFDWAEDAISSWSSEHKISFERKKGELILPDQTPLGAIADLVERLQKQFDSRQTPPWL